MTNGWISGGAIHWGWKSLGMEGKWMRNIKEKSTTEMFNPFCLTCQHTSLTPWKDYGSPVLAGGFKSPLNGSLYENLPWFHTHLLRDVITLPALQRRQARRRQDDSLEMCSGFSSWKRHRSEWWFKKILSHMGSDKYASTKTLSHLCQQS